VRVGVSACVATGKGCGAYQHDVLDLVQAHDVARSGACEVGKGVKSLERLFAIQGRGCDCQKRDKGENCRRVGDVGVVMVMIRKQRYGIGPMDGAATITAVTAPRGVQWRE